MLIDIRYVANSTFIKAVSSLLALAMGFRWSKIDFKFPSPPGIVTIVSILTGLYNLYAVMNLKK